MINLITQIFSDIVCLVCGYFIGRYKPVSNVPGSRIKDWIKRSPPKIIEPYVPEEVYRESEDITDFVNKLK